MHNPNDSVGRNSPSTGLSAAFPPGGRRGIAEIALIEAGFDYKAIRHAEEMPACFSRPICSLIMLLDNQAGDSERDHLLPYVRQLVCSGPPDVEKKRCEYITRRTRVYLSDPFNIYGIIPARDGITILEGALAIGAGAEIRLNCREPKAETRERYGLSERSPKSVSRIELQPVRLLRFVNSLVLRLLKVSQGPMPDKFTSKLIDGIGIFIANHRYITINRSEHSDYSKF